MTEEQRLDRLERIVKLMIKAGLRARRQSREQDEKINILIDMHMKNEERYEKRFAANEKRFALNEKRFALNEKRVASNDEKLAALAVKTEEKFAAMAAAQASAEEQLKSFIATVERIITERRNGKP